MLSVDPVSVYIGGLILIAELACVCVVMLVVVITCPVSTVRNVIHIRMVYNCGGG